MKRLFTIILAILALAGAGAGIFVYQLYRSVEEPYQGYPSGTAQVVDVTPGMGTQAIGQRLIEAGVVRDRLTYRAAIWRSGHARRLQAGEYRFERSNDAQSTPSARSRAARSTCSR